MKPKSDLKTSLFQISEQMRTDLLKVSAMSILVGNKKSVNDCILEALTAYVEMDDAKQPKPAIEGLISRKYTIRMSDDLKSKIQKTAAKWQVRTGLPIPMNAVVNKSINLYLERIWNSKL